MLNLKTSIHENAPHLYYSITVQHLCRATTFARLMQMWHGNTIKSLVKME